MKTDIYQDVTNRIIEALETGCAPWVKGWKDDTSQPLISGMPYNQSSGKAYRGINILLTLMATDEGGYSVPAFVTYKQAQALGGNVRKGEKGTKIVFFKPIEKVNKETGETEKFPMARAYTVFNIEQCDGIEVPAPVVRKPIDGSLMLDVCKHIGAEVRIEGNQAAFWPTPDMIRMPHVDQFSNPDQFEATLAHELTHWTGHKSRLNRDMSGRFGSEAYAFEELVAELGAAFMSAEQGFCIHEMRHDAYIENWLKVLKEDKKAIFTASSHAQKACDFIKEQASMEEAA